MCAVTTDGFSAWVSIGSVKLPQYGVETTVIEGVKTVSCWIASEVDKEFEVGWSIPAYPEQLVGDVFIDGVRIGGWVHVLGKPDIATWSWKGVSDTTARRLMFSRLEVTDDDVYLNGDHSHLGEITIDIWVTKPPQPASPIHHTQQEPTQVHERAKKAISHRVIFGDEFTPEATDCQDCIDERQVMSFIFKYRSQDYLQAEGIIPLEPKPDARPHKRAAETPGPSASEDDGEAEFQTRNEGTRLRQEQLQVDKEELELQERELQIQREKLRIRREELQIQLDATNAKGQRKKAKLEPQEVKLQVKTETIDLT